MSAHDSAQSHIQKHFRVRNAIWLETQARTRIHSTCSTLGCVWIMKHEWAMCAVPLNSISELHFLSLQETIWKYGPRRSINSAAGNRAGFLKLNSAVWCFLLWEITVLLHKTGLAVLQQSLVLLIFRLVIYSNESAVWGLNGFGLQLWT